MLTDHRNAWLDVCRSFAILVVLLAHGRFFLIGHWPSFDVFRAGGSLGVELFFGLSGLLIGQLLLASVPRHDRVARLMSFWRRRWFRTLPTYYLLLAINVGLALTMIRPANLSGLLAFPLLLQNVTDEPSGFYPESWSLSVEELFYLLLPLVAVVGSALFRRSMLVSIWTAALAILIVAIALRTHHVMLNDPGWESVRKSVLFRLDATTYGLLAGLLYFQHQMRLSRWMFAVLLSLLAFCVAYLVQSTPTGLNESVLARTLLFSGTALGCCGALLIGLEWRLPRVILVPTEFVARTSYSAYLLHLPIVSVMRASWTPGSVEAACVAYALYFVLVFGLSWLLHRGFERPMMLLGLRPAAIPVPA